MEVRSNREFHSREKHTYLYPHCQAFAFLTKTVLTVRATSTVIAHEKFVGVQVEYSLSPHHCVLVHEQPTPMDPADSSCGQLGGGQRETEHDVLGTVPMSLGSLKRQMIKSLVSGWVFYFLGNGQ